MNLRQPLRRNRFTLLIVAIVLIGAGCSELPAEGVDVGQSAPNFTLESFDGETVSLSDFKGQPVFLDFWAAWCPFCTGEIPEIQAFHEGYDDLVVIGIHRTETESQERAQEFIDELGVTYLMLKDVEGSVYETYSGGRPFMPLAVFIDEDGQVQTRLLGPKTVDQMKEVLESL